MHNYPLTALHEHSNARQVSCHFCHEHRTQQFGKETKATNMSIEIRHSKKKSSTMLDFQQAIGLLLDNARINKREKSERLWRFNWKKTKRTLQSFYGKYLWHWIRWVRSWFTKSRWLFNMEQWKFWLLLKVVEFPKWWTCERLYACKKAGAAKSNVYVSKIWASNACGSPSLPKHWWFWDILIGKGKAAQGASQSSQPSHCDYRIKPDPLLTSKKSRRRNENKNGRLKNNLVTMDCRAKIFGAEAITDLVIHFFVWCNWWGVFSIWGHNPHVNKIV